METKQTIPAGEIDRHRMYNFPRDYTVNQARELFDYYNFSVFSFKEANSIFNFGLDDFKHIRMFNCLDVSERNGRDGGWYLFTKNPHEIIL